MKAAIVKEKNVMVVEEIPIPEVNDDSMLIRVEACGVCGSDLRIYHKADSRAKYPIIAGHEIAGKIEKLGKNVKNFKIGDGVCVAPGHGCGECVYCQKGQKNLCINPKPSIGYAHDGGFAQYFVPPVNVIKNGFVNKIPEGVSFEEASISEPVACCINGHRNTKIEKGNTVLIFGAGPIGCIHVKLSKLYGASKVFLVDTKQGRLDLAKKFEPDKIINSYKEDLKRIIMDETNGIGVDVVFVCAPSKEAQLQGLKLLAPKGRINFFGGLPKDNPTITIDANQIHYRELGIGGASSSLAEDNKEALRLISEGKINAKDYISHTLPLDKIKDAFRLVEEKSGIKIIVKPWA